MMHPKSFYLTWHDDLREAKPPCDGNVACEETHVFLLNLLQVSVQQLQ